MGPKPCFKQAMVCPSYFIKDITVTNIVFFRFHTLITIGKYFSSRGIRAYLPTSISPDVMKFAAALSHCATHKIDVSPYKVV